MSFAFETRNAVGQQVRTITARQVEKALDLARSDGDFDETVHRLRRSCKKIRGMLRLVQPNFEDFKSENAAVRAAADLLGGARDARVMVETLDALIGESDAGAARASLVYRAEEIARAAEEASPIRSFSKIFEKLGARAKDWSFDSNGYDLVGDGLEKTYRQFVRDMKAADEEGSAEALHEWRKQCKYHWHHVSLLEKSAPDLLEPRIKALDQLGQYLGDHHNLAVLEATLNEVAEPVGPQQPILDAIGARQAELAGKALALGHQLAAEKTSALRKRFEAYWALLPEGA